MPVIIHKPTFESWNRYTDWRGQSGWLSWTPETNMPLLPACEAVRQALQERYLLGWDSSWITADWACVIFGDNGADGIVTLHYAYTQYHHMRQAGDDPEYVLRPNWAGTTWYLYRSADVTVTTAGRDGMITTVSAITGAYWYSSAKFGEYTASQPGMATCLIHGPLSPFQAVRVGDKTVTVEAFDGHKLWGVSDRRALLSILNSAVSSLVDYGGIGSVPTGFIDYTDNGGDWSGVSGSLYGALFAPAWKLTDILADIGDSDRLATGPMNDWLIQCRDIIDRTLWGGKFPSLDVEVNTRNAFWRETTDDYVAWWPGLAAMLAADAAASWSGWTLADEQDGALPGVGCRFWATIPGGVLGTGLYLQRTARRFVAPAKFRYLYPSRCMVEAYVRHETVKEKDFAYAPDFHGLVTGAATRVFGSYVRLGGPTYNGRFARDTDASSAEIVDTAPGTILATLGYTTEQPFQADGVPGDVQNMYNYYNGWDGTPRVILRFDCEGGFVFRPKEPVTIVFDTARLAVSSTASVSARTATLCSAASTAASAVATAATAAHTEIDIPETAAAEAAAAALEAAEAEVARLTGLIKELSDELTSKMPGGVAYEGWRSAADVAALGAELTALRLAAKEARDAVTIATRDAIDTAHAAAAAKETAATKAAMAAYESMASDADKSYESTDVLTRASYTGVFTAAGIDDAIWAQSGRTWAEYVNNAQLAYGAAGFPGLMDDSLKDALWEYWKSAGGGSA